MGGPVRGSARWLRWSGLAAAAAALGVATYFAAEASAAHHTVEFSSLRTDPEGTRALFGAYQRLGLRVIRGYNADALGQLTPAETVVFVVAPGDWGREASARYEDFMRRGGRVFVAHPSKGGLAERLGASLGNAKPGEAPTLTLHGPWIASAWQGGRVSVAQRKFGRGEAVAAGDAEFLSNEALSASPDLKLLAWLVAGRTTVWVDETTHMLGEVRGMPWLVRRYQLGSGLQWLLIVAGLWVWMRAARLERAPQTAIEGEIAVEETFFDGYVRLLGRIRRPDGGLEPAGGSK